jgi:N-acetylglucosamine-6-sulfatase
LVVIVLLAYLLVVPQRAAAQANEPPTIVLIVTDDQRWDTLQYMPTVQSELVGRGVTFTNAFVTNPLCCPSRASILTGRYSHGTGVYTNGGAHGGFDAFHDSSTIATWLHQRGYRTALVGKYLNGYRSLYIPPGWDHWFAFRVPAGYFDYTLNVNGAFVPFGSAPPEYSTDVLGREAVSFIRQSPNGPLFLYFAPFAPHFRPANVFETIPAPRHEREFADLPPWRPPSYNEPDVTDKPAWLRRIARLTPERRALGDSYRRSQLQSLLAVDDAVGQILAALAGTGRLQNTLIAFTSDNGLAWGEHRRFSKFAAYEENIRVPLVVRYDALGVGPRVDQHLALNIDLAPTMARAAGTSAPGADGRSLLPLLSAPGTPWRRDFLVEHLGGSIPTYCAVRTARHAYVQYRTGEEELYDLRVDPDQRVNRAHRGSVRRSIVSLRTRTRSLCKPPPPGFVPRSPCLVSGNSRGNRLYGTSHYDYICAYGGDDRIVSWAGDDRVVAGYGNDLVYGLEGADTLYGGPSADRLRGGLGPDRVEAVDGTADMVDCGAGLDVATVDRRDRVSGCETVRRG